MKKTIALLLAMLTLVIFTKPGGTASVGNSNPSEPPAVQEEMEDNTMPNVPVLNIGGTDYNVKDSEGRIFINTWDVFPFGSCTVTTNPSIYYIYLNNLSVNLLDRFGGYRFIHNSGSLNFALASDDFLVLSSTENSYTKVDLSTKGNGETLYVVKLSTRDFKKEYCILAINHGGTLYSLHNFIDKNINNCDILAEDKILVFPNYDKIELRRAGSNIANYTITNLSFVILDKWGGYRNIDAADYIIPSQYGLLLSGTSGSYTVPKLDTPGNGEKLYLVQKDSRFFNEHENVMLYNWNGRLYSYQHCIEFSPYNGENGIDIRETKGVLPKENFDESPFINTLTIFDKLKAKSSDVTIVQLGDSISTNDYASALADAAYRPPRMDESYLPNYIWDLIKWRGQEYRRSDAMTEQGGSTAMFTETCASAENKNYDEAWDWDYANVSGMSIQNNYYRLWTRVLSGNNCSVSFTIPAGVKTVGFIYRTDYLCADSARVSVSSGNSKIHARLMENDSLVEANGFTFSMKESSQIINETIIAYDGTTTVRPRHVSKGQKRLILHVDDISTSHTITITNVGSGRLNYWGIEWSKYAGMVRYMNFARGGHNISALNCFEADDVDSIEPDLILYQCPIINEGAMSVVASNTPNTPAAFASRFAAKITALNEKEYSPEVIPYVLYIGSQANIVNQTTGEYLCSYIGDECVDVYKYIGALDDAIREANNHIFVNLFHDFDQIAHRLAEQNDGNVYTSAIEGSGVNGNTLTIDNVHLNDYGSLVAYRLIKKYLNY